MIHITIVEGEGLTTKIDYAKHTTKQLRISIADEHNSVILDCLPGNNLEIKFVKNYLHSTSPPQKIFSGSLDSLSETLFSDNIPSKNTPLI